MAPGSTTGRLLPVLCTLAFRVPCTEGAEPKGKKTEGAQAGVCRRCSMKTSYLEMRPAGQVGAAKTEGIENVSYGREVREATTGRVVAVLPRVWATAQAGVRDRATAVVRPIRRAAGRETPRPELAFYRKYTEGMLRRYVQLTMEAGRVPSMLGREMFRGRVTSYRVRSFEDVVIFRLDMERCLRKLDTEEMQLIRRIGLQEYTQGEAALMLGMSLRTCVQRYGQALDRLTGLLLECRMLEPLEGCQGADV